jgi:hypothetical protein
MKITVQAVTVDMFANSLTSLAALLEKGLAHATARKFEPSVLFGARLAPDMFPLSRQVQIGEEFRGSPRRPRAAALRGQREDD